MIYRVVFTPTARAEAMETFGWLSERSPDAATRWYAGLEKAIAKLATFPESHPLAEEESERLGSTLRQMIYGHRRSAFRILFSVEKDIVYLHYVRHSARGPIDL